MIASGHSHGRPARARALLALVLALCISRGAVAAQQTTAAPAAPTPAEDSISAAKRDFDAVKAARNPALQQKGDVPRMSVPDLRTGTPAPSPTAPKKSGTEKKSANWLVEAMEKQEPRKERGREGERDKAGRETNRGISDPTTDSEDSVETRRRDQAETTGTQEEKREDEPVNPLASYLGEWMTPQDYALLKPSLERSLSKSGLETSASPLTSLAPSLGSIGAPDANTIAGTNLRGALAPVPRENPYLATLGAAPQTPTSSAPVFVAPPAPVMSAPSAVIAQPAMPEPVRSKIPEFAKPAQDEKYFKQLKRF